MLYVNSRLREEVVAVATPRRVALRCGVVEYVDSGGSGPVILLLHGALMNETLWSGVVDGLGPGFRCVIPVLPVGAHRIAMEDDVDLSPTGLADLLAEFVTALDLPEPTVVGNDTGGALAQLLAVRHPDRVGRLMLVSCDAFDNFPPGLPGRLMALLCRVPGALTAAMLSLRVPPLRRLPMTFGWMSKHGIEDEVFTSWLTAFLGDRRVRRNLRSMMRGVDKEDLLTAAERLRDFTAPTLIVWAEEDKVMPVEHAWRLADRLPDSEVELVPDSYTLVPLDQPARLAALISRHSTGARAHGDFESAPTSS